MDDISLQLSPDCWFMVFDYLELKHQIRLFKSFRGLSAVIADYWHCKFRCAVIYFLNDVNVEEIDIFVASMCRTFEVMNLKFMPLDAFETLVRYEFPKIHDFRFSQSAFKLTDEDILRISRAFPNLKTFSPQGKFSGRYMWELKHLENLTLTHCHNIDMEHVIRTLRDTSIKSVRLNCFRTLNDTFLSEAVHFFKLERIFLNVEEWQWLCRCPYIPVNCGNLKELTLTEDSAAIRESVIAQCGAENIRGAQFHNSYALKHALPNLQSLSLTMCPSAAVDVMPLVQTCKDLSEINFYNCPIPLESHITNLLLAATQLNRFNIEDCPLSFKELRIDVPAVVKERTKLLTLNFHGNFYYADAVFNVAKRLNDREMLKCSGESALFRVTQQKTDVESKCEYLQFKFK